MGLEKATLLTARQVAELLQVTTRTLRRWRAKGAGPPYVKLGSSIRYEAERVEEWINEETS